MDTTLTPAAPAPDAAPLTNNRRVDGELVYAFGDVHGRYDLLKSLLEAVWADCDGRRHDREPILIFCGDFIDRGPQSADVLDALNWLTRHEGFRVHLLKGNHEQAMLEFLLHPERGAPWLSFGGDQTMASYGVTPPPRGARAKVLVDARDALLDQLPASHMLLLQRLQLMVTIGDYTFVHAGVRPGAPIAHQAQRDLLWIREGFVDFDGPHERYIVHGHSWTDAEPQVRANRVGLDTGAYATGVLTAVRLQDGEMSFLQTTPASSPPAPGH